MKESKKKKKKASTTYIWSVFISFSIHSGPRVDFFKKQNKKKRGCDIKSSVLQIIRTFECLCMKVGGAKRMKTACDCDVQRKRRPVRDQELRPR